VSELLGICDMGRDVHRSHLVMQRFAGQLWSPSNQQL